MQVLPQFGPLGRIIGAINWIRTKHIFSVELNAVDNLCIPCPNPNVDRQLTAVSFNNNTV